MNLSDIDTQTLALIFMQRCQEQEGINEVSGEVLCNITNAIEAELLNRAASAYPHLTSKVFCEYD